MTGSSKRYTWSERFPLDQHHTFRRCWDCGLMRITRHESDGGRDVHWIEWRRNGERIDSERTPACEPAAVAA